jgi:hypothetical protein
MLARRLTTILPAMTLAEAIETKRIHSAAGLTGDRTAWVTTRLCRAPHHAISDAGLIGGGHVPMPGEVSLAHHGVLFLDELPEFRRHVLEVLRQLLENDLADVSSRLPRPADHRSASRSLPHQHDATNTEQVAIERVVHLPATDERRLSSRRPLSRAWEDTTNH